MAAEAAPTQDNLSTQGPWMLSSILMTSDHVRFQHGHLPKSLRLSLETCLENLTLIPAFCLWLTHCVPSPYTECDWWSWSVQPQKLPKKGEKEENLTSWHRWPSFSPSTHFHVVSWFRCQSGTKVLQAIHQDEWARVWCQVMQIKTLCKRTSVSVNWLQFFFWGGLGLSGT